MGREWTPPASPLLFGDPNVEQNEGSHMVLKFSHKRQFRGMAQVATETRKLRK